MLGSTKKVFLFFPLFLAITQSTFAQQRIEVIDGDSVLIFSFPMANLFSEKVEASVQFIGDLNEYNYEIVNDSSSEQRIWLWLFISEAKIENPHTPNGWRFINRGTPKRVTWGAQTDSAKIDPGSLLEDFKFQSSVPPTIKEYYMEGWAQIILEDGQEPDSTENDSFFDTAKKGITIFPRDTEISSLETFTDTLETFRLRSCDELNWANDAAVCGELENQLSEVKQALSSGDSLSAANTLQEFIELVESEKGTSLTSEGYALLYFNGKYLWNRLLSGKD